LLEEEGEEYKRVGGEAAEWRRCVDRYYVIYFIFAYQEEI
jgi:hypothetical protein